MSENVIAVRPASYGPFESVAYEHLAGLGVNNVEIAVPPPAQIGAVRAALNKFDLTATSLQGECDVSRSDVADQVETQMRAFEELGCRCMFVSVKAANTPLETVYARLREAGDAAALFGVTIVLETHPDLVTNAEVALQTMRGVDHAHVRLNYDTANIYYYNRNVDAVAELRKIVDFVSAVHLKDTDGGYHSWCFPALGRGIVDFPAIFEVLDDAGFAGPHTLEIEGLEGEQLTERLACDRIAESLGYLRGVGRL